MTETQSETPFFLAGNYGPVADELTVHDLPVTGAIPPELSGRYLHNGPNPPSGMEGHWFFGDGMVHGVRLDGGRAEWYRNRFVRTAKLERGMPADPMQMMPDPTASAANTHVIAHAGRIWALEEAHLPYELTPELDTIGLYDFGGRLTTPFTAHPRLCPQTGELHFFGSSPFPPYLTYHVLDAGGQLVHSAPITLPGPAWMHDFMITREHAIFMDLPVLFNLEGAMRGEPSIAWSDGYGARVGIVPRFGTDADVRWFEVEPCFVFHPLNAFIDGDTVVCDVGRHESMWRDSMDQFSPSYLHRWRFNLTTGEVQEQQLDDVWHGFPRVADDVVGLPNRYGWANGPRDAAGQLGGPGVVVKYDLETGRSDRFDLGPTAYPDEFVFVPGGSSGAEDDGYAMGFVYDATIDRSDLVILDATDPRAEPVARVHLPSRVPHGFHGSWVSDAALTR
ncbi:carotenoid oxygenase family protein [Mycobacterium sp. IS-3022]|uniref:carotenoid oxygenase family protein n=1 Tax=Mycobacterium sp. IS-3022 TaxID=1772277 RepID=UPI000741532B|nr:carotenoid oxygenase family protein [Mycobacterium sp. IS-3022]KUI01822.1 hypothetical protein AU188_17320 [Mycobacterium sp. IS-3022]